MLKGDLDTEVIILANHQSGAHHLLPHPGGEEHGEGDDQLWQGWGV